MARGEVLTYLVVSGFLVTLVEVPIDTFELVISSSSLKARSFLRIDSQSISPVKASVVASMVC